MKHLGDAGADLNITTKMGGTVLQRAADEIGALVVLKKSHERMKEHNNDPAVMLDKARAEAKRFGDLSIKYPDDEYYAAEAQIAIDKANELHRSLKSSEEANKSLV